MVLFYCKQFIAILNKFILNRSLKIRIIVPASASDCISLEAFLGHIISSFTIRISYILVCILFPLSLLSLYVPWCFYPCARSSWCVHILLILVLSFRARGDATWRTPVAASDSNRNIQETIQVEAARKAGSVIPIFTFPGTMGCARGFMRFSTSSHFSHCLIILYRIKFKKIKN